MKNNIFVNLAAGIILAAFLCLGILNIINTMKSDGYLEGNKAVKVFTTYDATEDIKEDVCPSTAPYIDEICLSSSHLGSITINTDKETRTFEFMDNTLEETLLNNIGHLPGSALPNEDGLMVLMGHRNTDLAILEYIKIGNAIIINFSEKKYNYLVKEIVIVSDEDFKFSCGYDLALVTCYPFRYSGNAPEKIIVYAKKK